MANTKEIKNRIASVKDTQKITNAMYLIASTKMRRAKRELDQTRPYFDALQNEIKRIFRTVEKVDNRYFYPASGEQDRPGDRAYLVITADKGLAGAYNQNAIREAQRQMDERGGGSKLFVVGDYGRQYFAAHKIPIEKSFLYTAQNPTLQRARDICSLLLDLYKRGEVSKIYVVYTDFNNGLDSSARTIRLLPFHRAQFISPAAESEKAIKNPFDFFPTVEKVLDSIIPSYLTGYIYSALVDSFCCEQNARMTAMDAANRNAQELLDSLAVEYNHVRQGTITQEITEIAAGAKGQRRYKEQLEGGAL